MIVIDANILLYAFAKGTPQHEVAQHWLDERINEGGRVALPWQSLTAFVRIVTNKTHLEVPAPFDLAWKQVEAWLSNDNVWIPVATDRHFEILNGLVQVPGFKGALITDAHLAALAIEHGLTVCSNDIDFARFPGVKWMNPLLSPRQKP